MMQAAIAAYNADVEAMRCAWEAKYGRFVPVGDDMRQREAYYKEWREVSGFNAFMRRVYDRMHRKHGFVKCGDAPGWRYAG